MLWLEEPQTLKVHKLYYTGNVLVKNKTTAEQYQGIGYELSLVNVNS